MSTPQSPGLSRRHFIQTASTVLAAASLSPSAAGAEAKPASTPPRNAFAYRFMIGDIEAYSISDGHILMRSGVNLMWPEAARPAMTEDLIQHGERTDGLPLYVNILLLKIGNEIALFDAGFGPGTNPNIGWVGEALTTIGVDPAKVTQAFLSHAHSDHIGGFVTNNKLIFPNAALHCLKEEVEFWRSPTPDFSRSKRAKGPLPGMIKDARDKFDVLQPNLQLHRDGDALLNGAITFEAALGHTSGHAMFRIRSGKESMLHIMDVAHHHVLMFTDPAWGIEFDHEPEEAVRTRRKVWAQLAASNERAYGFHLPWPGLGRVAAQKHGYAWRAERWNWGS